MEKEKLGTLLAIITALFSGIAIPANKVFVVSLDPAVFTALRAIIIGIVFLGVSRWQFGKNKSKGKKFISTSWKYLAIIAVVGGAAAFLLFFTGLKLTTAGRAGFLHKTLPLYTAVLAYVFLKEKISRRLLSAIAFMFLGTIGIYWASIAPTPFWADPQLGDLLVISAAILWAVENVVARKAMVTGETNFIVSFVRMFFGGLILFGFVILTGKVGVLLSLTGAQMINIGISTVLLLAYVFFYYWSLKLINVSKAAAMLLLAPVVSLVLGVMFLGEPAPPVQLLGSALILVGAYLAVVHKSEHRAV